jgi:hypothetical protein
VGDLVGAFEQGCHESAHLLVALLGYLLDVRSADVQPRR